MEFVELLAIGRDLKKEDCSIIRDCLEKVQELENEQMQIVYTLNESGIDLETAILGVWNGCYTVYDNFIDYINNYVSNEYNLPDFIELDYISMWYRTFKYDDNIYIDWQEWEWCKNRDEYGTSEQKEQQKEYIKYNLEYSQLIEFFY